MVRLTAYLLLYIVVAPIFWLYVRWNADAIMGARFDDDWLE